MLRLAGGQPETLFDEALPTEARELPRDLARLDGLLSDSALLEPIERGGSDGTRARPPNDRDGEVRAPDGDQAAHRLGL
jgi:hypothetical protein